MKNNTYWIAALLLSLSASSQTLKPILRLQNNDTLLCFSINQSRVIAKYISEAQFCDSIKVKQDSLICIMKEELSLKDSAFYCLNQRNDILHREIENGHLIKAELNTSVGRYKKRFTSLIVQRAALVICSIALSTALIIKK